VGEIDEAAQRLLRKAGITKAPVEVERVAKVLGAEIRLEHSESDVSGGLYRLTEGPVIGVNASHPTVRQRFTIAHEIGHLTLHERPVFIDRTYVVANESASQPRFLRNAVSSEAVDPLEIEANRFAACLLMPLAFLARDLRGMKLPVRSNDIETLADTYKVSGQAMTIRLTNLGVPLDQGD
jgi:Zn-dependent peptidase ImmA (M78 family)